MKFDRLMKLAEERPEIFGLFSIGERDPNCGEPVSWGFYIHFEKVLDKEERAFIERIVYRVNFVNGKPFMQVKTLTKTEAIKMYGPITEELTGPDGKFVSITFGDKKFVSWVFDKNSPLW